MHSRKFDLSELTEIELICHRVRNMDDNGSSIDNSSERSSAVLANENGRNKRKFLSDLSQDIPVDVTTLSLTEFPRYEVLEEIQNALNVLGSRMEKSKDTIEDQQVEEDQQADWDDPVVCQLEELLTNNLFAVFCSAVKKIVECGYSEEAAEWAVLNSSLFHGSKDAVTNVVDGALALLKREKEFNTPKHPVFEGLQSLVDYTLLEMIYVLREVRPRLSVVEAMWCLLINDLNLVNACVLEGGLCGGSSGKEASGESPQRSKSDSGTSGTSESDSNKLDNSKQIMPPAQNPHPEKSDSREYIQTSSQVTAMDEKSGSSRKGPSTTNSKREMLRQKAFHFEKNYKGRLSKGAFKAKVAAWGSMVLDKSLKSQSSSSSSVVIKGTHSMLATSAETTNSLVEENNHQLSRNSQSLVPANALSGKDPVFALPAVNSNPPSSSADPRRKGEKIGVSDPQKTTTDYYASIPFDEVLQKHVPKDDKDVSILMLVPHKQALEKEIQGWTDWANEKVMQAARRLGKEQRELKLLRQEREEMEKFKKEKQNLEESTVKRLSEMEFALSNATGQIEVANSTVRRLEEENHALKMMMEMAKSQALRAASNLQEAMVREQENMKKLQSWDAEKGLVMEQLANLKPKIAELDSRIEKAKERQNQFKVLLKQEEKEKSKVAAQIDLLRKKKEEVEASTKVEADNIKQTAQTNKQKCEDNIKNLENMISELRLESDKSKIAALNVGYGSALESDNSKITKRLAVFQDNFGDGDVKPERECVMCMTDEISVVFLPCSHQVLCGQCSALHEKQGMNDCPSCRTVIQNRISVSYRSD